METLGDDDDDDDDDEGIEEVLEKIWKLQPRRV
jgi:hypothetical protein